MKAYRSYLAVCIILLTSLISGCCLRPPLAETVATDGTTEVSTYRKEPSVTSLPTEESSEMWPEKLTRPESIPQSGVPITPQPGDTSATWDRTKAEQFPSDDDCTDMELLEKWMAVEGITYADFDERGCTQLLLVCARETDGVEAYAVCYEEQDGTWKPVEGFGRMHGWVGYKGIQHDRRRGTYRSPAGLWGLGLAFGNEAKPDGLKMPWRDVTPNSEWVGDEYSRYFNTWQECDDPTLTEDWDHAEGEHLEDYPTLYAYAVTVLYNIPPYTVPNRGCAIFLHCSEAGTGGCIGLPREDLVRVLCWLEPTRSPHIFVTGFERPE